jgi:glycosyltransferase involved in cell wall biosynthesis
VLPTYYDPCSRTVLEALSLGVPSITTSYDGSRECIRDGEHGYVLKSPDDVDALAHALKDLSVEGVRQRISQNALKLRPYLSMRRHAKEVAALYEEIVRTAAPTPMLKQI